MEITWDIKKAKENRLKQGVFFSDVEPVFYDPNALSREDQSAENEARYIVVGLDALGRLLTVVYTYRQDTIRIISARQATKRERNHYEHGL